MIKTIKRLLAFARPWRGTLALTVSVLIAAKKRLRVLYVVFPRCSEKEHIGRISDESSRNAFLAAANIVL